MTEKAFHMDADSLLSKWGFGDGDSLDDWWWDTYDSPPDVNTDELLYSLVAAFLVPALRDAGYEVELERIGTIHNPVRARTLNGAHVDHYPTGDDGIVPPVVVSVSRGQIEALLSKVASK